MKYNDKKLEQIIQDLKAVAQQIGVTVRFEKGDFRGGYCILKDSRIIVINRNSDVKRKSIILAKALSELGLEEIYLPPNIKQFIEDLVDENESNNN